MKEFHFFSSFKVYLERGEWIVISSNLLVSSLLWHKKYCEHFAANERNISLEFFISLPLLGRSDRVQSFVVLENFHQIAIDGNRFAIFYKRFSEKLIDSN